jgi:hypothetical protein
MGNDKTNNLVCITQNPPKLTFANFALGRRHSYQDEVNLKLYPGVPKIHTAHVTRCCSNISQHIPGNCNNINLVNQNSVLT